MTMWDQSRALGKVSGFESREYSSVCGKKSTYSAYKTTVYYSISASSNSIFQYLGITLEWLMSSLYLRPMATYPFKLSIYSILYTQEKKSNVFKSGFCLYNPPINPKLIQINTIILRTRGTHLKKSGRCLPR